MLMGNHISIHPSLVTSQPYFFRAKSSFATSNFKQSHRRGDFEIQISTYRCFSVPVKNIMLICSIHHLKVHIHIYTVFSVFRWKTSLHFFGSQEMDYFRLPKPPASPPERPVGGTRILCIAVCLPFTKVGPGKIEGIDGKWLGVSMIFRK
jgi:hypothetical protein